MSFDTHLVEGKPVLIQTLHAGYTGAESARLMARAGKALDKADRQLYYVLDLRAADLSLSDIVLNTRLVPDGTRPVFFHPNVLETLIVTHDTTFRVSAMGLQHPRFGNAKIKVFDQVDEALAYCGM